MASEEHQILVNKLALALERRGNITIQAIDLDGAPQHFDPKYRDLPLPSTREGGIPDLEGMDANGVAHLGEAETDMNADNLDDQLKNFSNWAMTNTDPPAPIPLHIIVPKRIWPEMKSRIRDMGLGDKMDNGEIAVWYA